MVTETLEKVEVVVDDRERPSGVVPELEKLGRVVVKIEHLSLGDYCIDGAVLIERKTAADFAQSLLSDKRWRRARTEATEVTEYLGRVVAFFALRESAEPALKSTSND